MNRIQHPIYITAEWISEYSHRIEAPQQTLDGKLIAPATMPIIFWQEFDIPWLNVDTPLIHGSQRFTYKKPITEGMLLDCELTLTKVENKAGRSGDLTLLTHTLICNCGDDLIVTAETILIGAGSEYEKIHI